LGFEHLAAAVHAGLQVDVVRPAQFTRVLILYVSRPRERIRGATHSAPRRRCLAFGDGHGRTPGFFGGFEANCFAPISFLCGAYAFRRPRLWWIARAKARAASRPRASLRLAGFAQNASAA